MFFPDRIRKIGHGDRVLEIGPGNKPHPRADILLERRFAVEEARQQRGLTPQLNTKKPVVFYEGGTIPFADAEFDYVICSHVIEHVEDVEGFCNEMFRVGRRGYVEFPTVYYEYLYNFSVHLQLINFESGELRYMAKCDSGLRDFQNVQALFYRTLVLGYSEIVDSLKHIMFQGIEWNQPFQVRRVSKIEALVSLHPLPIKALPRSIRYIRRALHWINGRFNLP